MVAPLYTEVSAGMRAMLDDLIVPGGATFTDDYNQKYIEMAQETMVNYLIGNSVERAKFRTETPLVIPAGTTILDYSVAVGGTSAVGTANVLPDDLILPDQLWEAKVNALNSDFFPMSGPNPIPRIPQSDTLGYWNWYGGLIHLLGSTVDRWVRADYWSFLPAVNPAGRIKVVASGNALISLASCYAARSRGQYQQADRLATFDSDGTIGGQAGWELDQIINQEIKAQQSEPVRRQPMFGRDRYSTQNYFIKGRT
jgi:hypothetical protein